MAGALLLVSGHLGGWKIIEILKFGLVIFVVPTVVGLTLFIKTKQASGFTTSETWLKEGESPEMTWTDLIIPKTNDLELLNAPQYFRDPVKVPHKYSYWGLTHYSVFSDPLNLFQILPMDPRGNMGSMIPDHKVRTGFKTQLMAVSISLGLIWTLFAVLGFIDTIKSILLQGVYCSFWEIYFIFSFSMFLMIFISMPFTSRTVIFGYWTPRLILPFLIVFYLLGFRFIEKIFSKKPVLNNIVLILAQIQCIINLAILI